MSEINTTKNWNGMVVEEYTNIITGKIELRTRKDPVFGRKGTLLATSESNEWNYVDEETFRRFYNNSQRSQGNPTLTKTQFDSRFRLEGQKLFDNDRANILNTNSSEDNRRAFYVKNIPFIKDPITGIIVNSDGTKPTVKTVDDQPEPEDQNQTLLGGGGTDNGGSTDNGQLRALKKSTNQFGNSDNYTLLKYPLLEPPAEFQYDYIMIQAFDYVASGLSNNTDALKNLGTAREITILPMQPNISETNVVNWSDDQLNPVKAALGDFAIKSITNLGEGNYEGLVKNFNEGIGVFKDMATNPFIKQFAASYFAGQAVGSNILGRSTGMVVNPNLELLFNGPNLRTFNFSFRFTPRNKKEAEMIRLIIRAFKRNSAVIKEPGFLFLRSPRVFKLQYIYKGSRIPAGGKSDSSDLHPYLNKIKPCALTSFSVNYTPDNSYMTFENGSLTCYQVDMTFSELMPIYEDELRGFKPNMGY